MKELYRVQYMDDRNYGEAVCGGWNWTFNEINVEAENANEAVAIVKTMYPEMHVNEHATTVAELEAREKAIREKAEKEEAKKEAKKAYEKAHPEIVEARKRKAKIAKAKREIAKAKKAIEEAEKEIEYWKNKLNELEAE